MSEVNLHQQAQAVNPQVATQAGGLSPAAMAMLQKPALPEGKVESKTYYTRIPNSTFVVSLGESQSKVLQFHNDRLITDDALEQKQLDGAADKIGSLIYTKTPVVDPGERIAQLELQKAAGIAAQRVAGVANPQ